MSTVYSQFGQIIRYWWLFLLSGSALIAFGVMVCLMPVTAYATLTGFFIAAFVLNGIAEIGFGVMNRSNRWLSQGDGSRKRSNPRTAKRAKCRAQSNL